MTKTGLSYPKLFGSIALGIIVWTFFFNLTFALVLVAALMIHEYGHYYWMGKEGIQKRDMIMLPGLGALARSYEMWPSYGAEGRIAVAGPVFGLFASSLLCALFFFTHNPMWAGGVVLSSFINVLNLLPALPLDGGRCIRSLLVSIHPSLEHVCFIVSIAIAVFLFFKGAIFFAVIILFLLLRETGQVSQAKATIKSISPRLEALSNVRETLQDSTNEKARAFIEREKTTLQESLTRAQVIIDMPRMNAKEMFVVAALFIFVVAGHAGFMWWMSSYISFSLPWPILDVLKYF